MDRSGPLRERLGPQAQAEQRVAQLNVQRTEVRATTDGIVTNLDLHAGDYLQPGAQALALIDTRSLRIEGYFEETKLGCITEGDAAVARLKREAAALGANGVVLMGVGSSGSPVGMSVGAGSYGRHSGGGLSMGIPTTQKQAAGVAIYVPPGTPVDPTLVVPDVPPKNP